VMNLVGKVVMQCVIKTKASVILQFIHGLRTKRNSSRRSCVFS
jgi:hypothetical protein